MTTTSWVPVPADSDFPITNLPYGIFTPADGRTRVGVAIGDHVLDLATVLDDATFASASLNPFMAQGRARWQQVRVHITELLTEQGNRETVEPALHRRDQVRLSLPFEVADYVDFYASEEHASNIGRMFRPDSPPLMPNWKHLPVGYHGRAGTVVESGAPIVRPCGQRKPPQAESPTVGPSQRLDVEAEVGFVVGAPSRLGTPVPTADFAEHVFGVCLVNDWSARDIQSWEYVPLGPFLGKSFATSVSPWIVPLNALEQARVPTPVQDPEPCAYLQEHHPWGLRLDMEVSLNGQIVARPPAEQLYWSPAQQLAHMTVNGASLRTGDFYASGTVSGTEPDQRGSLIELTWNGDNPLAMSDGTQRVFLADHDTVTIRATAPGADDTRIGFGAVTGTIQPAATHHA